MAAVPCLSCHRHIRDSAEHTGFRAGVARARLQRPAAGAGAVPLQGAEGSSEPGSQKEAAGRGGLLGHLLADILEPEEAGARSCWHRTTVREQLAATDSSLNQSLMSSGTTITQLFDQDKWERHRYVGRYFKNVATIGMSTVFRRIISPCMSVTAIAAAIAAYNLCAPAHWVRAALPPTAHTLLGAAISLLLVFRTNACYARFVEGRMLWGSVVKLCRDWLRLSSVYLPPKEYAHAASYIQAFPWVLKAHLRKGRSRTDPTDVTAYRDDPSAPLAALLTAAQAAALLASTNRPLSVELELSRTLAAVTTLPDSIRLLLEDVVTKLNAAAGGCERLLSTPVPLSYTRHTSRSMMLWLLSLPLVLWSTMGLATVPATAVITFILIGIDELGFQIEEPFAVLPLQPLCMVIQEDASMVQSITGPATQARHIVGSISLHRRMAEIQALPLTLNGI